MSDLTIKHAGSTVTTTSDTGLNKAAIIRVQPTFSTDAYAQGDVLFNQTEIPKAVRTKGGVSMLRAVYVLDEDDTEWDATFIFSEGSTNLGTINATADISMDNLISNKICGAVRIDGDIGSTTSFIDDARLLEAWPLGAGSDKAGSTRGGGMLLQAASDSTSVYFTGVLVTNVTPTFTADSMQFIFHVEYLS